MGSLLHLLRGARIFSTTAALLILPLASASTNAQQSPSLAEADSVQALPPAGDAPGLRHASVEYRGDVLVVEGVQYKSEVAPQHSKGMVLIEVAEGQLEAVEASIARLGLTVRERRLRHVPMLSIEVPVGYETHWTAALRRQSGVHGAWVNQVLFLHAPGRSERAASGVRPTP
jgi:hypothetical protein